MSNSGSKSPASAPAAGKGRNIKVLLTGNLLALSTALCWGLNEPANKALIPEWISASGVALSRIFGATLLVWIISLFIKREKIQKDDWKNLVWA